MPSSSSTLEEVIAPLDEINSRMSRCGGVVPGIVRIESGISVEESGTIVEESGTTVEESGTLAEESGILAEESGIEFGLALYKLILNATSMSINSGGWRLYSCIS